jgi:anti-sigma factor RsiW
MASLDERLHKLHDGELAATEAEQLRTELTTQDQEKLAALAELDQLIAGTLRIEAEAQPLDLWAAIADKLPAASPAPVQAPAHAHARLGTVLPLRRRAVIRLTAVTSALAVAAAVLLFLRPVPAVSNHCEVEELEVAGDNAAVISVADDHGNETTLIWFDHQEDDQWESL